VYADAAEPDRIQEIYDAGFNIRAANKDVESGILSVKEYENYVYVESDDMLREQRNYKYAEDRAGNILEKPVKVNDHLMDSIRYSVYTHSIAYWAHTTSAVAHIASKIRNRQQGKFYEGYTNGSLSNLMDQRKRIL
jgi:phage terminase large subunit